MSAARKIKRKKISVSSSDTESEVSGSSSSDSEAESKNELFKSNPVYQEGVSNDLKEWAVENGIRHKHLDGLLDILRSSYLPNLPKSSKTFLESNLRFYIQDMEASGDDTNGQFYYFGIKKKLIITVLTELQITFLLELIIFLDGISPFKSSPKQCWVTLCKIYHQKDIYKPFTVSIYAGEGKPKNADDYLSKLVTEINLLQSHGVEIDNKHFQVKVKFFIADTPARALLKGWVSHVSFDGCERCIVKGVKVNNVTVFLSTDEKKITDEDFRSFKYPDKHNGSSMCSLIEPGVDMISQFIIDPMHLCFLGVVLRILEYLLTTKSNYKCKVSSVLKEELNRRTKNLKKDIPFEFPRKMKGTNKYSKFKAVDLRFFILYAAPIVYKKWLSKEMYNHLMKLVVSLRLLSMNNAQNYTDFCKKNLKEFVDNAAEHYGTSFMCLNVHNLSHLTDDVVANKCNLNELSAFCFESYLGTITKSLRSATNIVAQYCRRSVEKEKFMKNVPVIPAAIEVLQKKKKTQEIVKIRKNNFVLTKKHPDNTVHLENNSIAEVVGFLNASEEIYVEIKKYQKRSHVFDSPCNSGDLDIWKVSKLSSETTVCSLQNVKGKFVKFNVDFAIGEEKKTFVVPHLHQD